MFFNMIQTFNESVQFRFFKKCPTTEFDRFNFARGYETVRVTIQDLCTGHPLLPVINEYELLRSIAAFKW